MKILDLGALGVAFSALFIPVLIFCRENSGRRCIFPDVIKIRPKNVFLRILGLDDFFKDKTDPGVLRTFSVVNKNYNCILYD
jgi:hypothetical protein